MVGNLLNQMRNLSQLVKLVAGIFACLAVATALSAQTTDQGDNTKSAKKKSGASQSGEPYYVDGVEYKPYVPDTAKKPRRSVSGADGGNVPAPDMQTYPTFSRPAQDVTTAPPGPARAPVDPSQAPTGEAAAGSSSSSASSPAPRTVAPGVVTTPGTLAGTPSSEAAAAVNPKKRQRYGVAIVRALDKVTAESVMFEARIGQPVRYKGLVYMVRACETSAPEEARPDVFAYLEVRVREEGRPSAKADPHPIFRGWTFASSPGINAMQHPVYDAWVIACKAPIA